MENLKMTKLAAGGFRFLITKNEGNVRLGKLKQKAIINAIENSWTEGVYKTTNKSIKRQLLNGSSQFLMKDRETGIYCFI